MIKSPTCFISKTNKDVWDIITKDTVLLNGKVTHVKHLFLRQVMENEDLWFLLRHDHFKNVKWWQICEKYKLTEKFMILFSDKIYWPGACHHQELSDTIIELFSDKLDWYWTSKCQKLSEKIIERFKDRVDWYNITVYQDLSDEFKERYKDDLHSYLYEYQEDFRFKR